MHRANHYDTGADSAQEQLEESERDKILNDEVSKFEHSTMV